MNDLKKIVTLLISAVGIKRKKTMRYDQPGETDPPKIDDPQTEPVKIDDPNKNPGQTEPPRN
jgi:hypothetical protein